MNIGVLICMSRYTGINAYDDDDDDDDDSLPEGRLVGIFYANRGCDERGRFPLPTSDTAMGEQLNLYKVTMQWFIVDLNPRPSGYKTQNIPLHHRVPTYIRCVRTYFPNAIDIL